MTTRTPELTEFSIDVVLTHLRRRLLAAHAAGCEIAITPRVGVVETTQPGDTQRTYRPSDHAFRCVIEIADPAGGPR